MMSGIPSLQGGEDVKEAHGLHQTDLPEIGGQGVVSELLNGRRELNLRQIKALAARFKISPETFIT